MRTKTTNILQMIILITGLIYIATGLTFFISPLLFGKIFSINITQDWFNGIKFESFVAPLFFMARGFAAMLFSVGLAMVLPLFDPLKYRGLIYYTGIVFPLISSSMLLKNGIELEHWILIIYGIIFLLIFICTMIGLIITKDNAKVGIE